MEFYFNSEKNAELLKIRKIGFEEIISAIVNGHLLAIAEHTNKKKYPHQQILYVQIIDKIYAVPCVIKDDGTYFLKTLFPIRKARKQYF